MTATITRRLVSLADTADALAVSTRTIRRYIADGQLEAVRLGVRGESVRKFTFTGAGADSGLGWRNRSVLDGGVASALDGTVDG